MLHFNGYVVSLVPWSLSLFLDLLRYPYMLSVYISLLRYTSSFSSSSSSAMSRLTPQTLLPVHACLHCPASRFALSCLVSSRTYSAFASAIHIMSVLGARDPDYGAQKCLYQ